MINLPAKNQPCNGLWLLLRVGKEESKDEEKNAPSRKGKEEEIETKVAFRLLNGTRKSELLR